MMENVPCFNKSCNRLDKYHLLTQQWVDRVIVTVSGKEAHNILIFLSMLTSFFNYLESKGEMILFLHHYQTYYNTVKKYISSDHACLAIDKIARSIEIYMKYFCSYHFIDITTFHFLSDSIVKAAKFGLKRVDITVSTKIEH